MYYKVLKDGRVIDVLDHLSFVKYQEKNNIMVVCAKEEAQAIISSNGDYIWHVHGLYAIPVDGYDTVYLKKIDKYEYDSLKMLCLRDVQSIIDEYTLSLIEGGIL